MSKREMKDTVSRAEGQQAEAVVNDAAQKVAPDMSDTALDDNGCSQSGESDCEDAEDFWKDWGWKKAHLKKEQGAADGQRWAKRAHPNELRLFCGHFKKWNQHRISGDKPLWHRLLKSLPDFKKRGPKYSKSFAAEVHKEYSRIRTAWAHLNYSAGLRDGEAWARGVGSVEKLSRLQSMDQREGWNPKYREYYLFDPKHTPAHGLSFVMLKGDREDLWEEDGEDEYSEADYEKEFNSVWQQFVSEPLDDVTCRLLNPEYVIGFANGALGRTKELEARFFNRKETPRLLAPQQ